MMDELTEDRESENKEIMSRYEPDENAEENNESKLLYGIGDRPPWITSIVLAMQHFSSSFTACIVLPILLSRSLCFDKDQELLTKLIATNFFVTGVGTILQVCFGCRLPILQGPSAAYLIPIMSMMQVRGECPAVSIANATEVEKSVLREEALSRMREVQGVMICAAFVQCLIGFTGLIGLILRYIGPITLGVTILMIGVGIIPVAMNLVEDHWCISIPTIFLVILFSMVLSGVSVPFPGGKRVRIFALFPMMIAIVIMWFVCLILTIAGVFPDDPEIYGYAARVDTKLDNLNTVSWFSIPYPGQWGMPTFNVAGFVGVLTAVVASIMDSLGDYHACSQVARVPPPPTHAINRGIGLEGIGCVIGALCGSGIGVTSHSSDIAVINLSKVASRSVMIQSGILFTVVAFLAKFCSLVNGIPTPVLGSSAVAIGMISAIGIANFQHVNMESSRNILVVGISIFTAIGIPDFFKNHPTAINTGLESFDRLCFVLLSNKMFMAAVISALLDNLLPGTPEERGMNWRTKITRGKRDTISEELSIYQLPFGMEWIKKKSWMKRLPFSPTFRGLGHVEDIERLDPENTSV